MRKETINYFGDYVFVINYVACVYTEYTIIMHCRRIHSLLPLGVHTLIHAGILTTTFVESKLAIVKIKIGHVSYCNIEWSFFS